MNRLYRNIRQWLYNKRHGVVKLSPRQVVSLKRYFREQATDDGIVINPGDM